MTRLAMPIDGGLERFRRRPPPPMLGVATVGDFVDSLEILRPLAEASGDHKDVQRPWTLKTVAAIVPPGGHVCEIGAGHPHVASILADHGYRVTVVDPYDGSGHGPVEWAAFVADHPRVRFLRRRFGPGLSELRDGEFDAICSISVVEHLDQAGIDDLIAGSVRFLRPGGRHVHAIDHVAAGPGDAHHRTMLGKFLGRFGIGGDEIDAVLARAMVDPETYFLSAEAHNRWRGSMPYASFPMRKVVSVQFVR
jgi:hypothetical protein